MKYCKNCDESFTTLGRNCETCLEFIRRIGRKLDFVEKKFYVYALCDDEGVFYIGLGSARRAVVDSERNAKTRKRIKEAMKWRTYDIRVLKESNVKRIAVNFERRAILKQKPPCNEQIWRKMKK